MDKITNYDEVKDFKLGPKKSFGQKMAIITGNIILAILFITLISGTGILCFHIISWLVSETITTWFSM